MENSDLGTRIEKIQIWDRDKHLGSATLPFTINILIPVRNLIVKKTQCYKTYTGTRVFQGSDLELALYLCRSGATSRSTILVVTAGPDSKNRIQT
jgi:hypothetical protein